MKKYYGFRFYSGRDTTWNNTHYIAGDLHVFKNLDDLKDWISKERMDLPCGNGGGERIRISRADAIRMKGIENYRQEVEGFLNQ